MNIKNVIIATVCGAAAITAGNVISSLILNKIYAPSKKDVEKINNKIHEIEDLVNDDK